MTNEQEERKETSSCPCCGHDAHKPRECEFHDIVKGCICGSCWGWCTCDGTSYDVEDYDFEKQGGPYTKPGEWEIARWGRVL